MRSFEQFLIFACLFLQALSRPQQIPEDNYGSEAEEREYENDSVAADDDPREEVTGYKEQNSKNRQEELQDQNQADSGDGTYSERDNANDQSMKINPDFSEFKSSKTRRLQEEQDASDTDDSDQSNLRRRTPNNVNKYVDNSDTVDQQERDQHLKYREVNANKLDERDFLRNKQTDKQAVDEVNMLFETKDGMTNINDNKYDSNEVPEPNEPGYPKSNNNAMEASNGKSVVSKNYDNVRYFLSRDTRQVMDTEHVVDNAVNDIYGSNLEKNSNEDEESAIKRHIRKLSKEQLEELKNSLSDDKKVLLKKFIDEIDTSDSNYDISKREITKKGGAIKENNLMDSGLADSINNQGVTSNLISTDSSMLQNSETTETNKLPESQSENNSMSTAKSVEASESENKSEVKSQFDESYLKSKSDLVSNIPSTSKNENKRETNLDDFGDINLSLGETQFINSDSENWQDLSNENNCIYSQDENLSPFVGDKLQPHDYNVKNQKRDTSSENEANTCDFKSLEESFPKSNSYDESVAGHRERFKRTDIHKIVKKRSAGVFPDTKVAYFPYRSENEDEDNEEGNEFDDEGFYDRTSNIEKQSKPIDASVDNYCTKLLIDSSHLENIQGKSDSNDLKPNGKLSGNENLSGEKMSLGSDTDSILSGSEGVDDNLMFNSDLRDKRTAGDDDSASLTDKQSKPSQNYFSAPNYQENDAFGALPRNYDGDLGRYKRIRRVKQSKQAPIGGTHLT